MAEKTPVAVSKHDGAWSNAALVISGIASGSAAKLLINHYGFKSDQDWAITMREEFELLLSRVEQIEREAQACAVEGVISTIRHDYHGRINMSTAEDKVRKLATLPSGYCIVPLEPTDKMVQAAWDIQTSFNPQAIKAMYRAMIKARK